MFDRKQLVRLIWDAINDPEDWGSIQDVQDLADAILALPVTVTDEMVERAHWAQERHWQAHEGEDDYGAMRAALEAALTPRQEPSEQPDAQGDERDGHA